MDIPQDLNPRGRFLSQYTRKTKFIISLSVLGLVLFLSVSAVAPFKDQLFSRLYPKPKSQAQEVSVASGLTTQLIASRDRFNTASGVPLQESTISAQTTELTNMIDIASQRKTALLNELKQDPNLFLKDATLADQRSSFPPEVQGYIEEKTTIEGTLIVLAIDDFKEKKLTTEYSLLTKGGEKVLLHPVNKLKTPLISGLDVKVAGIHLNNELTFDANQPTNLLTFPEENSAALRQGSATSQDTVGVQKVAVILVNFNDTTQPNLNKEGVRGRVFDHVNNFYKESSYGKTSLEGDAFGWYNLPIGRTCNYFEVLNRTVQIADKDIDYKQFRGVIILAPFSRAILDHCGWGGLGTVGRIHVETPDGSVLVSATWLDVGVDDYYSLDYKIAHEFGHNLGLMHANFLNCGSVSIASSGCVGFEYGDMFSVMGFASTMPHFTAAHKDYLGWFNESMIKTIDHSGTYTLEPFSSSSNGLKALKIPRNSVDLYIENRQPIGFDAGFMLSSGYDGALVHSLDFNASNLYAMNHPADNYAPALPVGSSATDPEGDIITVKSRTNSSLNVEVVLVPVSLISNAALSLNGQGLVFVKDNNQKLVLTTDFTIETWVKPIGNTVDWILSRYSPTYGFRYDLYLVPWSEKTKMLFLAGREGAERLGEIEFGSWSHVAVVKQGTIIKFFTNGRKVSEVASPLSDLLDEPGSVTVLGAAVGANHVPFGLLTGALDELRISNSVRDISANWDDGAYYHPLPIDQSTLAIWRFENNAKDSGPNHIEVDTRNVDYIPGVVIAPTPTPTPTPSCPLVVCDVNGDGKEDINDGNLVNGCWNKPATGICQKVDVQCDGVINIIDIQKFAYACPQIFPTPTPAPLPNKINIDTSIQIQDKIQL